MTYNSAENISNQKFCQLCSAGKYRSSDASNALHCLDCLIGFAESKQGQAACTECRGGSYQSKKGQPICINCLQGFYLEEKDVRDANTCTTCPVGFINTIDRATLCIACIPGRFQQGNSCTDCWLNEFTNTSAAVKCKTCPLGYISSLTTASSSCVQCPAGKHGSKRMCRNCPKGFARDNNDPLDSCIACKKGYYQGDSNQVLCLACIPGEFICFLCLLRFENQLQ